MGMMYAHHIKQGAHDLLKVLRGESSVRYSRFYDATDETRRALCKGMEMSEEDADWYGAEGIMDEAAAALAAQGYVKITRLQDLLADGEHDYLIDLTEEERAKLEAGQEPVFRNLDL